MKNDKISNLLSSDSDNFRIVKEKIHPDVFSEFIDYEKNLANKSSIDPESIQKKEFTELAADGSIEAFRQIERILSESEFSKEVRQFGLVALNFCRFKIENDLLDEPVDMISGGLGGTENKMRYFLALIGRTAITSFQFDFIKDAFDKVTKDRDSILEEAQNLDKYVTLLILGSYDYAIGEIVDTGIDECEFLEKEYYLTNVEIPTSEQILKWMNNV